MMSVVVFGDSITNRASDETGGGWTSRLWSKIFADFNTEYAPGVVCSDHAVIELGIGGDDVVGISRRFERELFTRVDFTDVNLLSQTLVGIAVGINDSRVIESTGKNIVDIDMFKSVYELVVDRLIEIGVGVFLVGLNPVDEKKVRSCMWMEDAQSYSNGEILKYDSIISEIATSRNLMFVNVSKAFSDVIEVEGCDSLLADGLHPNDRGHELISSEVFNTIKDRL